MINVFNCLFIYHLYWSFICIYFSCLFHLSLYIYPSIFCSTNFLSLQWIFKPWIHKCTILDSIWIMLMFVSPSKIHSLCRITCWNWLFNDLFCFQNLLFLGTPLRVFACSMHINWLVLSLFLEEWLSVSSRKGHEHTLVMWPQQPARLIYSNLLSLHTPVPTQEMLRMLYLSVFLCCCSPGSVGPLECLYARKTVPHGSPKANLA